MEINTINDMRRNLGAIRVIEKKIKASLLPDFRLKDHNAVAAPDHLPQRSFVPGVMVFETFSEDQEAVAAAVRSLNFEIGSSFPVLDPTA